MHSHLIETTSTPTPLNIETTQIEPAKASDLTTQKDIENKITTELMRSIYAESDCV